MSTDQLASTVNLHHAPKWLKQRIRQRFGRALMIHDAANRTAGGPYGADWLDHWGSLKVDGGDVAFVSEPYGLSMSALRDALRFAEVLDLQVRIDAASEWNPGATLRITFTPTPQERQP